MHQSFVTSGPYPRGIAGTLTFRSENPCYKPHTVGDKQLKTRLFAPAVNCVHCEQL